MIFLQHSFNNYFKENSMIPQTFNEWLNCIVNQCKINLTKDFARQRLAVYRDHTNPETGQFIRLYGEGHLQNIINWYSIYEQQ